MADYQSQYTGPQIDEKLGKAHEHSNKSVLDAITSTLTAAWTAASEWITTNGASVLTHLTDSVKHITAQERSAWNAKGTYSKPSGGIPSTDMSSAVQTSLDKADSALQSHQSLAAYRNASEQDVIDAGKADKVENATENEIAILDSAGNPKKSNIDVGVLDEIPDIRSEVFGHISALGADFASIPKICGVPIILYADVAPSVSVEPYNWDSSTMGRWGGAPYFIGQRYINISGRKEYTAFDCSSVNGWGLLN